MALTDIAIKRTKSSDKPFKIYDTLNLFLLVNPNGSKLWRLKFKLFGKEKVLALGKYPDVSLKEAREKRDIARKQIENGIDPALERKREKRKAVYDAGNTFMSLAESFIGTQAKQGLKPKTNCKKFLIVKETIL